MVSLGRIQVAKQRKEWRDYIEKIWAARMNGKIHSQIKTQTDWRSARQALRGKKPRVEEA
jgi:hypothetical protein